ncbi:MAG: gamma-glutamyl-gamma-aminobutyrate hydrolase family protein [Nitrospinota bacterium]|nr:gamma-glutamyl-gamma-aminobutyrate hydrolase family protein [Nitrospinota bacterium]
MYIFIAVQGKEDYYANGPAFKAKVRIEKASGERCLVVPYQELTASLIEELKPRAVVMGGFGGYFESYKVKDFYPMNDLLHRADIPILAICGSHQILGYCFNKDIRRLKQLRDEPIRRLGPGEEFPHVAKGMADYDMSGFFVAEGFYPIERVMADPIFKGLSKRMMLKCSHYCEVKTLPAAFELIAQSGHSPIEAMRHKERPIYGLQFHPEYYAEPFMDGAKILENFVAIVNKFWEKR